MLIIDALDAATRAQGEETGVAGPGPQGPGLIPGQEAETRANNNNGE